ncbi:MAG: hypothetical protein K0S38_534 [Candidatus Paceibacter sp.]|jgi:hypothetical protein|nr:hypothetical protein [Candidatus Paceibacter sp.]
MELLTDKEKIVLENLRVILEFGASLFPKLNVPISAETLTPKKDYALFNFGAIHNYSESIYVLCKDSRPHSAHVLLRSIFEAYVNTLYFLNTNSNLKLIKAVVEDLTDNRIKVLNGFAKLIKKYPEWENRSSLTNYATLNDLLNHTQKTIDFVKNNNRFHSTTKIGKNFRDRVEALDKKITTKIRGNWEFNYLLVYKYFSTYTHLLMSGLENFVTKKDKQISFDIGQSKDVEPIVVTTYAFYYNLLIYLKSRSVIPKSTKLGIFSKKMSEMNKEANII